MLEKTAELTKECVFNDLPSKGLRWRDSRTFYAVPDARIDQSPPFNVFSARFSTSHLRYSQANVCGHGLDLLASLWWQAGLGRIQPSWGIWGTRRRTMQALERFWRSQQRCSSITQRSV